MSSRLRPADVLRSGGGALLARPWRTTLSALGIAVGIGAAVAVPRDLGPPHARRLLAQLGAKGNLVTVGAGRASAARPLAPRPRRPA